MCDFLLPAGDCVVGPSAVTASAADLACHAAQSLRGVRHVEILRGRADRHRTEEHAPELEQGRPYRIEAEYTLFLLDRVPELPGPGEVGRERLGGDDGVRRDRFERSGEYLQGSPRGAEREDCLAGG